MATSIWGSNGGVAATPAATNRIPTDISSGGAPNHHTLQQLADLGASIGVTTQALGSINTNTTITWSSGSYVTATITGSLTFTFAGAPSTGQGFQGTLVLTNGGSATITWPGSVTWMGGTAPTLAAAGVNILRFITSNGGTNWYGWAEYDEPVMSYTKTVGVRLNDDFARLAVSPWASVGTNIWSADGTELACTNAGTYNVNFLQYPDETVLGENWVITARFKAPASITAGTSGIFVNLRSTANWFARNLYFGFGMATGNSGGIFILNNAGSTLASASRMTLSANDQTKATIRRVGYVFYATWENETTGEQASCSYSFPDSGDGTPGRAFVSLSSTATATTIQNVTVTCLDPADCDVVFLGDSISAGHNVFASDTHWFEVLRTRVPYRLANVSAAGMQAFDADADAVIADVASRSPTHCIVWLGTNDIAGSRTPAQAITSLQGIESKLNALGITPHFITPLPRGAADYNTLAASILSTFDNTLDFRRYFLQGASAIASSYSSDSVHPNAVGHRLIAREIEAYLRSVLG